MASIMRAASTLFAASVILGFGCGADQQNDLGDLSTGKGSGSGSGSGSGPTAAGGFRQVNLISDLKSEKATHFDRFLINPWGLASDGNSFWIANNGSGRLSIVDEHGMASRFTLTKGRINLGDGITAIVRNTSSSFAIHEHGNCGTAQMLVANEKGQIIAVNTDLSDHGQVVIDRSNVNASYKGLAIIDVRGVGMELLAADFHNGRIDVFDSNFTLLSEEGTGSKTTGTQAKLFFDKNIEKGMAPFNVMAIGDNVYITYGVQDAMKADAVKGVGKGRVDVFDTNGKLVKVLVDRGLLNAPWGIALAPDNFCNVTANKLIIGNFGDGTLLAVDPDSGRVIGQLADSNGEVLKIDGLWSLMFGDGMNVGQTNQLYFAAGIDDENHGLFGYLMSNDSKL
jgi:uncharacterized protein (TIGR03118 family)